MAATMTQIVFVAEPAFRNHCVPIATHIARHRNHGSRVLTPEAFVAQREQAGPETRFVLIGRNETTASFVDPIPALFDELGVTWGYQEAIAAIRVLQPAQDLAGVRERVLRIERDARNHPDNLGAVVVLRLFEGDPYWRIPAPSRAQMGQWASSPFLARERIREAQLRLGLLAFLYEGLVPFAGLPELGF